ncbi:MAG: hypothetical protein U1F67_13410 [Rubrivivax sp.]
MAGALRPDFGGKRLLCREDDCAPAPELRSSASWAFSNYAVGRFTIGWGPGLPGSVAALGNAWGAEPPGMDGCAALLGCPLAHYRGGVTAESATYESWTLGSQWMRSDRGASKSRCSSPGHGAAMPRARWARLANEADWVLPVGAVTHIGRWRVFALAATSGNDRTRGWNSSLSAAAPVAGGELRLGAWRYRLGSEPPLNKAAAGWHAPLSTHGRWGIDVAAARAADGQRWAAATLGTEWSWP